ncbi:sensor histidine kinase [Yoonia sp. MH D7]
MPMISPNYAADIAKLLEIEFGERFEPYPRLVAVTLAAVMIYAYNGSSLALIWALYFFVAFAGYAFFLTSRKAHVPSADVLFAAVILTNMQAAYVWFLTLLLVNEDRVLVLIGGILICTQLIFMVRRCDTLGVFNNTYSLIVLGTSFAVYVGYIPYFETPLAAVGAALALFVLNYYFVQTLRISRRIRQSRETAANNAHQAQKMAAIGQLAGGVAHDFNNNLTAIIGSLELLQISDNPRDQHLDLENALSAARQAARTVKHLMIFARMEKPVMTQAAVHDVFTELESLTHRLVPTSVSFEIAATDPALVTNIDRPQFLAGLINLVVNGVDAMPQGGRLTLAATQVEITDPLPLANGSLLAKDVYVQITVCDTGTGIPPDILSKVIDPFFTTKPVGKGTGLGLSMVAGMMDEFGGGLSIQSDRTGTLIRLFLPVVTPTSAPSALKP